MVQPGPSHRGLLDVRASADLVAQFREAWVALDCPPAWRRLLVAVSGGPDSLALLHLLHVTRDLHRLDLVVAHADHGIHPASGAVAAHVVAAADALALPAIVGRLGLGRGTTETEARAARHRWLEQIRRLEHADAVVLGHHQDDQVETILMRALAGSGPAGLAGMAPRHGRRLRPLLGFRKAELVGWLEGRGLRGWDDPANADAGHLRSWLRGDLLPRLAARLPAVEPALIRLGEQAATDRSAWDAALEALPGLDLREDGGRLSVAALPLATYDSALAITLLQAAARRAGCLLGPRRASRVLELMRRGRSGASIELGAEWRAEYAFGRVVFYQAVPLPAPVTVVGRGGELAWGAWRLRWGWGPAPGRLGRDGWVGWFIGEEAIVRSPRRGDRIVPLGGTGRRAVSRLLQEARVERSRRGGWPVVEIGGRVEWVAGVCRGDGAIPPADGEALRIEVSGG